MQASQKGGAAAATAYAQRKDSYLQMGQGWEAQGVQFVPVVIESTGGL